MSVLGLLATERRTQQREEDRVAKARVKFLTNPKSVDDYVSRIMQEHIPEGSRIKPARHATRTEAVDAKFYPDDPRKGLGDKIKTSLSKALLDPELSMYTPNELLANVAAMHLENVRGATNQYTREQQSALLFGDNVKPMRGYDEWLAQQQGNEAAQNEADGSVDFVADAPGNAAFGAALAGAGELAARSKVAQVAVRATARTVNRGLAKLGMKGFVKLASRGLSASPHPLAKIAGVALMAIPEFYSFEKAGEIISRSEWGQANKDNAKVVAAELLAGLGGAVGTGAAINKGLKLGLKKALAADLVSKRAREVLAKSPTATNVIIAHDAAKEAAKFDAAFIGPLASRSNIMDGVAATAIREQEVATRAKLTEELTANVGVLEAAARDAKYEPTAAARKKALRKANEVAMKLEKIGAETGIDIPELGVFKEQMRISELEKNTKTLAAKLAKAKKVKDPKAIAAFEEELASARGELQTLSNELGVPAMSDEMVLATRQLEQVKELIANETDEKILTQLREALVISEKNVDDIIATNISKISESGLEQVEKNVAKGDTAATATEKVIQGEKVIAEQAAESAGKRLSKAEIVEAEKLAAAEIEAENARKILEPTTRSAKMGGEIPAHEHLQLAKEFKIKGAEKMSAQELAVAIEAQSVRVDAAIVKLEPKVVKRVKAEKKIIYNEENLPPFFELKLGRISETEYLAKLTNPAVRKAEFDLISGLKPELIAERSRILQRANPGTAESVIDANLRDSTKQNKFEAERQAAFVEPSEKELAALEKSLSGDTLSSGKNVELRTEFAAQRADAETSKIDTVAVEVKSEVDAIAKVAAKNAKEETKAANAVVAEVQKSVQRRRAPLVENAAESIENAARLTAQEIAKEEAALGKTKSWYKTFDDSTAGRAAERTAQDATRPTNSLKTILALAGPGAGAIILGDMVLANDADAGVIDSVMRGTLGVAKSLGKEALANGGKEGQVALKKMGEFLRPAVVKDGQKFLPPRTNSFSNPPPMNVDLNVKRLPFFLDRILSQHTVAEVYYDKLANPMTEIAGKITASINDTEAAMLVVRNILDGVADASPLATAKARREVIAAMKPLEEEFAIPFARAGHATGMVSTLEKRMAAIQKKAVKGQGDFADELKVLSDELAKFEGVAATETAKLAEYGTKWEAIVKPLAAQHGSTRIALAVEDTTAFETYPWLASMLTFEEKEATAHFKNMMQDIGGRISAVGGKVISDKPYIHHAMHPAKNFSRIKEGLKDLTKTTGDSPIYSKFHSRTLGSRQMVPEMSYIMERYIPDINKRIAMTEFWKKNGWERHAATVSKQSEALKVFWDTVREGFKPHENTFSNKLARNYTSWEVMRLLSGSLSVPFKHGIKVSATMAQFPIAVSAASVPRAVKSTWKIGLNRNYNNSWMVRKVAGGKRITLTEQEQFIDGLTKQGHYSESIADLGINDIPREGLTRVINKINEIGSVPVRAIELFDRAVSTIAGGQMGARVGMTPQQSVEAVMKTIMQNNFLGGNQNPAWLRNPKIRAMMMFQGTPFKILERRLLIGWRTKQGLDAAGKETLKQLKELRANIREGETLFKASLLKDALLGPKDQFGQAYAGTFMKEVLGLGVFVALGKEVANVDLSAHAFHLPVVKFEKNGPTIALNPILQEAYKTSAWQDEDDFWLSQFFTNYTKGVGISNTFTRAMRLTKNDIPDIYTEANNPKLAYLFAVPAVTE